MLLTLCGSSNGSLWDSNLTWNTNQPVFSECLKDTLPLWIPCGMFWLFFPIEIVQLRKLSFAKSSWRMRDYFRLGSLTLLCLAILSRIIGKCILWSNSGGEWFTVGVISYGTLLFTIISITFITYLRQLKVYTGSGVSWLTIVALLVCGLLEFGTAVQLVVQKINNGITIYEMFNSLSYFFYYILLIATLIFLSFSSSLRSDYQMLLNEDEQLPWPEEFCSFPNQLLYWWFKRLIVLGYRRALETKDTWFIHNDDQTATICSYLSKQIDKEYASIVESKKFRPRINDQQPEGAFKQKIPHLFIVILKCFGFKIIIACVMMTGFILLSFAEPILVGLITTYAQNIATEPKWHGFAYVTVMSLILLIRVFLCQQSFYISIRTGNRIRSGLMSVVYRKALRLSSEAKKSSTIGEMVNLMSVDALRIREVTTNLHDIFPIPFLLILGYYYLYRLVGIAAFCGLAVTAITFLLNLSLAKVFENLQNAEMALKDERLKIMSEVVNGMKVIKLNTWEIAFENKIENIRQNELVFRKKSSYIGGILEVAWNCTVLISSFATFATFVLINPDKHLTPEIIFVSLTIYYLMDYSNRMLPRVVAMLITAKVSFDRMHKFLAAQELEPFQYEPIDSSQYVVEVKSASFSWESDINKPILNSINMTIPKGKLVAVVGKVGCGKSSLLSALCGEMFRIDGTIKAKGSIAYVPQQAWIQNMSLKDNILFSEDYDESLYQSILNSCSLRPDLETLPRGDLTEIGERGINLSGGQKMRVSLARAVYQDLDLYLFDDPFASVDVHVGKQIFEEVIGPTGLLRQKTRILVTHGLNYLPHCDLILVMKDGKIDKMGTFQELINEPGSFSEFIQQFFETAEDNELEDIDNEITQIAKNIIGPQTPLLRKKRQTSVSRTSADSSDLLEPVIERLISCDSDGSSKDQTINKNKENIGKLIDKEIVETGQVSWNVYWTYAKAAGLGLFLFAFCEFAYEVFQLLGTFWLQKWSDNSHQLSMNATNYTISNEIGLRNFGLLGLAQLFLVSMLGFCFATYQVRAARNMHKNLLQSLLKAPMSFFDTTPIGRIVNRCGRDMATIDENIPSYFDQFWHVLFQTIRSLTAVLIAAPYFGLALIPCLCCYYFVQRFYVRTSRQLRRLEAISRSPIYSHFQESLQGVNSIRAFRQQSKFIEQSSHLIDVNASADLVKGLANRWVATYMDLGGNLLTCFVALIVVIMVQNGMSAGLAGLALSYATYMTGNLKWGVYIMGLLESEMVSVERVDEYTKIEPEAPWNKHLNIIPADWPSNGEVTFVDYSTTYRSGLPSVLHSLSFSINRGSKVGVVGRTGAGKTSMILALFRLIEGTSGKICIDGFDISQMGLHDLRHKLTIIPQDPVLFSGTLRANIDPFDEFADCDVWRVLELSHLKTFIATLPDQLKHDISEGGSNLSVGQRQLICLSRALLRKSKILVLDEATASVDVETDSLIQETIREQFKECTVITIAHRLNTIMDNDKILVLENGRVMEFDSPTILLQQKDSLFSRMTQEVSNIK